MEENILEKLSGVKKNVPLANYTTYKIGGPAKYFLIAKTKEELIAAMSAAKSLKLLSFILGNGSNLLISDKGFKGLVIKMDISYVDFQKNKVFIGSGASLDRLAHSSADRGLSGLEWSAGVPGTVGGAIYGSAQAFGSKMSDLVQNVDAINSKTLELKSFTKEQCQFSVKDSFFKKNKNWVIVSTVLKLKKGDAGQIKDKINEFLDYRKTKHPLNFASAGSTFVNPGIGEFDLKKIEKLYPQYPELKDFAKKGVIASGYLIAKSGLAGRRAGNAQISEKHANFIVNLGGAKAKDVLFLMKLMKSEVRKKFGVSLKPEVQLVGFKPI